MAQWIRWTVSLMLRHINLTAAEQTITVFCSKCSNDYTYPSKTTDKFFLARAITALHFLISSKVWALDRLLNNDRDLHVLLLITKPHLQLNSIKMLIIMDYIQLFVHLFVMINHLYGNVWFKQLLIPIYEKCWNCFTRLLSSHKYDHI